MQTWLEVDLPYIKLFSPRKVSSQASLRKGCRNATLQFSVPLSDLTIVGQPTYVCNTLFTSTLRHT